MQLPGSMTTQSHNGSTTTLETNDFENPAIIRRNALPPRAYHIPTKSISLNGTWSFYYATSPVLAPDPLDLSSDIIWTKISVPGHWQLQGHGIPHYTNVPFPFPVLPPHVPSNNPTGTYRRKFEVPSDWEANCRVRLRFEGVDSAYHLYVNQKFVGYAQESRNASEFDITDFVTRTGANEVFVRVYQWSDGSYLEDQDQWWLSGIFRDVWLMPVLAAQVQDFQLSTEFDNSFTDAKLLVEIETLGCGILSISVSFRGKEVSKRRIVVWPAPDAHDSMTAHNTLYIPVLKAHHWTAETPNLYDVALTFASHEVRLKHGFRVVEVKKGLITINGQPIRLRGVNRHDHHPIHGRAVPKDFIERDLIMMKQHNINAIRTSHYPPTPHLLDLADALGFYVLEETDLECHGFYEAVARPLGVPDGDDYEDRKRKVFPNAAKFTSDNLIWKDAYVSRVKQMVYRDRNHPCVIIWSLGNESFYGRNHMAMYKYVKSIDPHRPVHYEGDVNAESADMFSYMYPSIERLKHLIKNSGIAPDGTWSKPIILCEYAHAMGNGPGGLTDYITLFESEKRLQGGFIWEWANHGLWKPDGDGKGGFFAYGGDFGDVPNDGTFVMDGLTNSNHDPTPGLLELKKAYEPVKMTVSLDSSPDKLEACLELVSRFDFLNSTLTGQWEIISNGITTDSGAFKVPTLVPNSTTKIVRNLASLGDVAADAVLNVRLVLGESTRWASIGHEVSWVQAVINRSRTEPVQTTLEDQPLHTNTTETQISISGPGNNFNLDRVLGWPLTWKYNQDVLFTKLKVGLWRPPTDNDFPVSLPYWKRYGVDTLTTEIQSILVQEERKSTEIKVESILSPPIVSWYAKSSMTYTVHTNGVLVIQATISFVGPSPDHIPRIGLDIQLPPSLDSVEWFGRGPGESYPDKTESQKIGLYKSTASKLETPYDVPQENGNRMSTRWLRITDDRSSLGFFVRQTKNWNSSNQSCAPENSTDYGTEHEADDLVFNWKVGIYSDETVQNANHPTDLIAGDPILRLDAEVAGVGTGACGPGVDKRHQVPSQEDHTYQFGFELIPLGCPAGTVREL